MPYGWSQDYGPTPQNTIQTGSWTDIHQRSLPCSLVTVAMPQGCSKHYLRCASWIRPRLGCMLGRNITDTTGLLQREPKTRRRLAGKRLPLFPPVPLQKRQRREEKRQAMLGASPWGSKRG